MTIAFVLGNGISRKDISLDTLSAYGKIYGCNALYREFTPYALVATDRPIATHIQSTGYASKNHFYTRHPREGTGAKKVPIQYYGYSSGPIALSLAAIDNHTKIYMVGFDMGPTESNKINNLYVGTEFYRPATAEPTFTGNWVNQLSKIITDYPEIQFIRVAGPTTAKHNRLDSLANLTHLDLVQFAQQINNKEDL